MTRAPFLVIDGKLYRWKDILELRRAQLAALPGQFVVSGLAGQVAFGLFGGRQMARAKSFDKVIELLFSHDILCIGWHLLPLPIWIMCANAR